MRAWNEDNICNQSIFIINRETRVSWMNYRMNCVVYLTQLYNMICIKLSKHCLFQLCDVIYSHSARNDVLSHRPEASCGRRALHSAHTKKQRAVKSNDWLGRRSGRANERGGRAKNGVNYLFVACAAWPYCASTSSCPIHNITNSRTLRWDGMSGTDHWAEACITCSHEEHASAISG